MAKFFIDRPIFAWVIAIFIIAAGIFGIQKLPISQYPSVAAPTITLRATYPGASAQVMEDSVLAVIERNMYGVEGLDYMTTSANSSGSGSVSLTFTPETDEDLAQVDVQNKLSEVLSTLPSTVQQYGVTVSKARSNVLQVVMLSSEKQSIEEMNDYAQRNIIPELQRIDGVGQVQLFGAQRAMRIWVDPKKLQNYNLSFATVTNALATQNIQISAGSIGSLPAAAGQTISATVTAQGQLSTAEEFGNIILVSNTDGSNVYLKDVAKVSLGMQDYSTSTRLNGVNTTGMAVMLSNSGNALATATAVKEKMAVLQKYFPDGMSWKVPYDTSKFVEISIEKVIHTLLGIKIWQRNDKNELIQAAEAESAVLNPDGSWQLKNIRRSILGEDKVEVSTAAEENWPISVKRNLMDVLLVKPDQMSVGELTTYIDHLEKNNQNTQVYAIAWWRKLVYPVAAWVMALVAFAFTPQTTRHGNMGLKLFGGICLGLLFHFAGRLFGFTSQLYGVPPFLAGALPTVLFALLAVYLIRRQEKR